MSSTITKTFVLKGDIIHGKGSIKLIKLCVCTLLCWYRKGVAYLSNQNDNVTYIEDCVVFGDTCHDDC